MKTVVVIPTYWGRKSDEALDIADVVYDHPTPLDEEGTLVRALDSFKVLSKEDFELIVIAVATNKDLESSIEDRVEEVVSSVNPDFPVAIVSHKFSKCFQSMIREIDQADSEKLINLYGYSHVRNFCLIVGQLRGADAVVLFDDDEVVDDPQYLEKATEFIGSEYNGKRINGIAGWYKQPKGQYLLPPTRKWWWMEWKAPEVMNQGFRQIIGKGDRLKVTPFVFGGNMVIHKDLFEKVPFDPMILRGEDIDYLLNAKMSGEDFYLDRELWIRHLQPEGRTPEWLRFRQDILRFIYMRRKIISQVEGEVERIVGVDELDPYPGCFLRDDLDKKLVNTSFMLALHYMLEKDEEGYEEATRNIQLADMEMKKKKNPLSAYMRFKKDWQRMMIKLRDYKPAKDLLEKEFKVG